MLKRQIAVGDIHGCFDLLKTLIERVIRFSPDEDMLIFMGDYIDRGKKSKEVVRYLSSLKEKLPDNVILLKGNHEDLAYNALTAPAPGKEMIFWRLNGGAETVISFSGIKNSREYLIPFIESLQLYYESDTHIFVHAGIPRGKDLSTATPEELLWDRDFSYDGEKTLVVGHTAKSEVSNFNHGKIICVDTGAFMTGILSAYDVINNKVYKTAEEQESFVIS
ncbi:MAG TPA: metallophosphoesterase family protein [Dissulfurispiraceae bacterium]|nr:metallophosphoesterase family protein [Dissulfurispiraceae bacterium]